MASMAAAGRSPADQFALCRCAAQGEGLPRARRDVCVDDDVRVPRVRAGGGSALSRVGGARSPRPRREPSQQ